MYHNIAFLESRVFGRPCNPWGRMDFKDASSIESHSEGPLLLIEVNDPLEPES